MAKVIFEECVNILNDLLFQPSVYVYLSSHARNELYAENKSKVLKVTKNIILHPTVQHIAPIYVQIYIFLCTNN